MKLGLALLSAADLLLQGLLCLRQSLAHVLCWLGTCHLS